MPPTAIDTALERFLVAIEGNRSLRHCLRRWSEFVRQRDGGRCVMCQNRVGLAAHHIIRRSFIPMMQLEPGNGICLCRECHRRPHEAFNRRPDLGLPMDFEGGDNSDVVTNFFGALIYDGKQRGMLDDTYYFLSDSALRTFKNFQGIDPALTVPGCRVEQAYLIWRQTPRPLMRRLLAAMEMTLPPNFLQTSSLSVFGEDGASLAYFGLDETSIAL